MQFNNILRKIGIYFFYTFSVLSTLTLAFLIIAFLFYYNSKEMLYSVLICSLFTMIFWCITFILSTFNYKDSKKRKEKFLDLIHKLPLILLSVVITGVYLVLIFFLMAFLTTSSYSGGGMGADIDFSLLLIIVSLVGTLIITAVMYKVMKTDKQDITLTIYNQFSVLKWTSLIILPFGLWASYYFYHTSNKIGSWGAMIIWGLIFYGLYRLFNRISNKVQDNIIKSNYNRIIHEKKKKILNDTTNKPENIQSSNFTEDLIKLKELLDTGVLTEEEFNIQKQKLLK